MKITTKIINNAEKGFNQYVEDHPNVSLKVLCRALDYMSKLDKCKYDQLCHLADKYGYKVVFKGKHFLVKKVSTDE